MPVVLVRLSRGYRGVIRPADVDGVMVDASRLSKTVKRLQRCDKTC